MSVLQNNLSEPVVPVTEMPRWQRAMQPFRLSRRRGVVTLLVFLALWQFVSSVIVKDPLFLVGPYQVVVREWHAWQQGQLQHDLLVSGFEFVVGFFPSEIGRAHV